MHVLQSNDDYINKQKIMELITTIILCDKIMKKNKISKTLLIVYKCIKPVGL